LDLLYLRDLVDVNHVEVPEYATRTQQQHVHDIVRERLNIPAIPLNYQHFHLHVLLHYSQKSKPNFSGHLSLKDMVSSNSLTDHTITLMQVA
jgi:hypothetical protein